MDDIKICPICGVKKSKDTFFFSHLPNKPVSKSEVYSKICRRVSDKRCLNDSTEYSPNLDFPGVTDAPFRMS